MTERKTDPPGWSQRLAASLLRKLGAPVDLPDTSKPPAASATLASLHGRLDLSCTIKVVDIGANPIDGDPPYREMLASGFTHVIGFEPQPEALAKLQANRGPNETYLSCAIGDGRRHTLRHCAASGMTSLLEPNPAVLSLFHGFPEWGRVLRTEEIDTVRLDDVPETASLDLLKIDIQGGELMVFQNAIERLQSALVIHTEVEFLEMYVGQPLYADVDMFLRRHGFVLHKFCPLISRVLKPLLLNNDRYAGLSQIVWAGAVFVRDFTKLDRLSTDQLLRSAVILHDCYQSFDVVLRLLTEYDRRNGTSHCGKYVDYIITVSSV